MQLVAEMCQSCLMAPGTKKGNKSHNKEGTVVSLEMGFCLNYEVLAKYCHVRSIHRDLGEDEMLW